MKTFLGIFAVCAVLGAFVGGAGAVVYDTVWATAEAATPRTRAIPHISPERFENLIVEPSPSCTVDFGVLSGAALGIPCRESSTCPAAKSGTISVEDACIASTAMTDGGVGLSSTTTLRCFAGTDAVTFQVCHVVTDAGTIDLNSATFRARIIH